MGQRWAGIIALGLALCWASAARAAEPLHFRHLTVDDGLSQSWVAAILKDSRGFVWVGTQNGLNRYDGTGFRVYTHDPADPASLSAASVTRLLEDSRGRLWVVTEVGLDLYDRERDRFERVRLSDAPNGDSMRGLAEGRSGQLWIATENGLVELDPERRTSVRTLGDPRDPHRFSTNVLLDVLVDRDGILWVSAASGGVNRFDPRTRQVTRFPFPEATPGGTISAEVHGLHQDEDGSIWVSVLGGGLGRIDPVTRQVTRYLPDLDDPHSLSTARVRCVLGDGRGRIYVGTENGGLDVLDVASGRFSHNRPAPGEPGALNSGSIYSLLLDDQGILWVGTYDGGVNYALGAADRFELIRTAPRGLSDPHVAAILEDRHGDVWIGTDGGGLNRWDRTTGRFTVLRHDPQDRGSLPTDALLALLEDSRGELWVAGWAGGLSRLDRRSGRFTRFGAHPPGLFDHVFAMVEDGPDRIVLGTLGGPVVFDRRTRTFAALAGVPPARPPLVQAVLRDSDGGLWMGHREGVDRLDRRSGRLTRYRPGARDAQALAAAGNCQALFQDSRGNVWIGTLRGLHVLPRGDGPLRRYTRADGLAGEAIKAVLEDDGGNLWVSTDRGLSRFAGGVDLPARPRFSNFNKLDGLQGDEFRYGSAFRSRSGEMFFGGAGGLNVFFPRDIQLNPVPPPVVITGLALSVRSDDPQARGSLVARSLAGVRELTLSHRQDFVTLEFAALNYTLPAKNQYAYRMEGLDTGWRAAGNAHSATYTHLPPGSYLFQVRAANNDGVWNEEGAALRIVVTPPFWATWWFRLAVLALLGAGLSGGYVLRVRSLRQRERLLARRVEERTAALQTEIAEGERAEAALRASEERYALAVRGTNDGIWDWDLRTNRVYYSPRWKAILGYGGAEIADAPSEWFDRVHPEDSARFQAKLAAHRAGPLVHCEDEHRIRHKDGDFRRVSCRAFAVHDESAACVRVVGVITDVTDRRAFDPLTGLPTRGLLLQHLDEALVRGRQDPAVRVAVFVLDLDRFKMVNDSFGHVVGDRFLIEVANRISGCLRPADLVARFAGDQFALMVTGVHVVGDAVRVMERIQNALKAPFAIAGTEVFASLSIGIALGTPDYERAEDLLRDGDTALHRAKASSTRHEIFEPGMRLQVVERLRVESDLRRALERDELHLGYQPILSLTSGRVEGFEGLVRWHHPERGLIMPGRFIGVAEETGLIAALGRAVMSQACRQLREWLIDADLPLPMWISVNVSPKEFLDPDFVSQVRTLVAENHVPRGALRVEITETTLLEGDQFVRGRLERLRELGVGIDIDDFGTGYSSLSYLQQLPIDTLKIDRVFVSRLGGPAADPTIVRAILEMAKNLGLSAVAEGVETRQQLERLARLGCPKAQGYYISAAVESAAARALLSPRPGEPSRQA